MLNSLYFIEALNKTDEIITAEISINPEHEILKAHFPDQAVVPGVCMLEMIKDVLSEARLKRMSLVQSSYVKFLHLLTPQQTTHVSVVLNVKQQQNFISCDASIQWGDTIFMKSKADYQ